jgi:hypothetical protein
MQSSGGIVDTGNQQTADGDNQRAQWPTNMRSTGLLWKEPGYKVAVDRKNPSLLVLIMTHYVLRKIINYKLWLL